MPTCCCTRPGDVQKWSREGATWADARASNASRRDFTVNGLLYEPFRRARVLDCTLPTVSCYNFSLGSGRAVWPRSAIVCTSLPATAAPSLNIRCPSPLHTLRSRLLFDSVGGVEDCQARRLRTICPPAESFAADPARILRGVRLAARASELVVVGGWWLVHAAWRELSSLNMLKYTALHSTG